jgi:hypothetical protein
MIWTVLGMFTLLALLVAPAAVPAQETAYYATTPPVRCTFNSLNVPGGNTTHRLAITWINVDPQTNMAAYLVGGVNQTTGADFFGYGHTSAGPNFPITVSGTDGPTPSSPTVRHWRLDLQANFTYTYRVVDALPTGNGTATGSGNVTCD